MKNGILGFVILILLSMASCTEDKCSNSITYTMLEPVYVLVDSLRQPAEIQSPRAFVNPGKIYFYNNYIFVNEPREGFHVINNANPANPINEKFVVIKGNVDLAVMNDYLYADAYKDLVILDLRDMNLMKQVTRKLDVFDSYYHASNSGYILSHYKESTVKQTLECSDNNYGRPYFEDGLGVFFDSNIIGSNKANGGVAPSQVGKGGSMARFTISKSHLYAIGYNEIFAMAIQNDGSLSTASKTSLPWGIETIFPYKDYLFIGAEAGMHIMSIVNPGSPTLSSTFQHARACDPVVVQDDVAYVTLRDGNECRGFVNQLDVIDVKDIFNPKLLYSYNMTNPHGLAIEGNHLYLCEGQSGLKVFDISDKSKIDKMQVGHYQGFHAWDAISLTGHSLLLIGNDGFRQYDHNDPTNLKLLSKIGK